MNPDIALDYLDFVYDRHMVYVRRGAGEPGPWAPDGSLLNSVKFTNVYRILDTGSQYLFGMMDGSWEDNFLRAFAYRYSNRPEPWQAWHTAFGRWPVRSDLEDGLFAEFFKRAYDGPVFGLAYKMFVGQENKGVSRLDWWISLVHKAMLDDKWVAGVREAADMEARYWALRRMPRCANFMAMQILADIGYFDPSHDENAFVAPGPGAARGARWLGLEPMEAVRWAHTAVLEDGRVSLTVGPRTRRAPSWMDIQNTLCEFGKFGRYTYAGDRPRRYTPRWDAGAPPWPRFPDHWRTSAQSATLELTV